MLLALPVMAIAMFFEAMPYAVPAMWLLSTPVVFWLGRGFHIRAWRQLRHGTALTPDEAKMVFSRFWRADAGRTRESGGLGIGLSVVKEIVERHNGWVQVEGRKGEGACFTIHIPLYQGDEQQRGQKSQKSRGKSRKDQK